MGYTPPGMAYFFGDNKPHSVGNKYIPGFNREDIEYFAELGLSNIICIPTTFSDVTKYSAEVGKSAREVLKIILSDIASIFGKKLQDIEPYTDLHKSICQILGNSFNTFLLNYSKNVNDSSVSKSRTIQINLNTLNELSFDFYEHISDKCYTNTSNEFLNYVIYNCPQLLYVEPKALKSKIRIIKQIYKLITNMCDANEIQYFLRDNARVISYLLCTGAPQESEVIRLETDLEFCANLDVSIISEVKSYSKSLVRLTELQTYYRIFSLLNDFDYNAWLSDNKLIFEFKDESEFISALNIFNNNIFDFPVELVYENERYYFDGTCMVPFGMNL